MRHDATVAQSTHEAQFPTADRVSIEGETLWHDNRESMVYMVGHVLFCLPPSSSINFIDDIWERNALKRTFRALVFLSTTHSDFTTIYIEIKWQFDSHSLNNTCIDHKSYLKHLTRTLQFVDGRFNGYGNNETGIRRGRVGGGRSSCSDTQT